MKKNKKKEKRKNEKKHLSFNLSLPEEVKRYLLGLFFLLILLFLVLGFFQKGGIFGKFLTSFSQYFFGFHSARFFLPSFLFLTGLCLLFSQYKKIFFPIFLSFFLIVFGSSFLFESLKAGNGGFLGKLFVSIFFKIFGPLISKILFLFSILIGFWLFFILFRKETKIKETKPSLFKRIFAPSFKIQKLTPPEEKIVSLSEQKIAPPKPESLEFEYEKPPLDLLEAEKGEPLAGDIKQNLLIIKKTLKNFGIDVEMGEVNVGPTVTQYTLKPAEGVKLSKITSLSNDLALALASHPIRIEAPIPGKSLVGIEVPNKVRSVVRLRNLISLPQFQNASSPLTFVLGRDVSGNPAFTDLAKMPHLLVAGATGTGKTIFLNSLILSLIYRNSPQILNFILIDPKRVEFPVYNDLPHTLNDVIFDVQKAINALSWLVEEMERRFEILARFKTRDIYSYNKLALKEELEIMPYIVLIIDELADLMAARGREIEAKIVRLAQMARAVGIHLVLATQRPSTEVITGLIKANITARVTFQVASQVDSRTVIDTAGAEKLLGRGDLLFVSAENPKPKRIQGAFVSEKEVKKVVEFLSSKYKGQKRKIESFEKKLLEEFREEIEFPESEFEDPLYEEAKRIVIEAKKASASLLQRKLKIGYARAARLLDLLEERGIVGPPQGAKPREVYIKENGEWEKI